LRIWTLHPKYLDSKGLVALWREALLARAVLRGETVGYRHHPQLARFRSHPAPRAAIETYLGSVLTEAQSRGYSFDAGKLGSDCTPIQIDCTAGQLLYEWQHLLDKLRTRSPAVFERWQTVAAPDAHPLFRLVPDSVEPWERAP
jgi:hypothetical protein